ncbi:glycosyltransferase family 9 protein [Cryobacterium sp. 1639]|uniref:glycosyltransferase family 9 protein n=1 Tax=Cryobacterium inferilacus TaxID=2866629 RepID=UPI001C73110A|nr:glycosyltransferase family 9 protein [Cryobacterium sp. 1639]MBX0299964.1 glycosyltransferase family 9 protein [Cryobacterium sp. 1639]
MTRRVLVARLDSLGDVVLAGPAVRAVAAGRPGEATEVWLLCGPRGAPAGRLLPGVHEVLTWSCPWIADPAPAPTPEKVDELHELVRSCDPDEAVILTSFHQSPLPLALLLRLAGVSPIVGASVDYAGTLLDLRLRPGDDFPEDQPEVLRALRIVAALGYTLPSGDDGRLRLLPVAPVSAAGSYLVVHPGADAPARSWPAEHFRALVAMLTDRGLRVTVTGGPGERELTRFVCGVDGVDLGGCTDAAELAALLAGAAAVITGNTGPAHLAAAVGTPVVSLFAPVVPLVRWGPYGVDCEILGDQDAPCRGSRARTCPVPGHPCLTGVSPTDAVGATLRLLSRTGRHSGRKAGAASSVTTTGEGAA